MTDWLEDRDEPYLAERRWPMEPTHLLPRERWLWWEQLWSDVIALGKRYRLNPPKDWWEDSMKVEALAALAAWLSRYDSGEWDDPAGKLALLYDVERIAGWSVAKTRSTPNGTEEPSSGFSSTAAAWRRRKPGLTGALDETTGLDERTPFPLVEYVDPSGDVAIPAFVLGSQRGQPIVFFLGDSAGQSVTKNLGCAFRLTFHRVSQRLTRDDVLVSKIAGRRISCTGASVAGLVLAVCLRGFPARQAQDFVPVGLIEIGRLEREPRNRNGTR
ncbi:hypothetical protein AYO39_02945 [Actinobacteria bacterium SCGC AG-212-D09]|nr:hypothetical protein AYO39_02945 [Actinobacteria bacterium SCGC AG-212-D09]